MNINITKDQLRWLITALEIRVDDLQQTIEWDEGQGMLEAAEVARKERNIYEGILNELHTTEDKDHDI